MPKLTIAALRREAAKFSAAESLHAEKLLYGVTDGKAVGTYLEHKFRTHLKSGYSFEEILHDTPQQGFLTVSNGLQWRLQYNRVIEQAGQEAGIVAIYRSNK